MPFDAETRIPNEIIPFRDRDASAQRRAAWGKIVAGRRTMPPQHTDGAPPLFPRSSSRCGTLAPLMVARVVFPERDVYANLLRDSRGLRRDQSTARDAWFAALPWDRKEETLFELEMLLKGVVAYGNPRNYPGMPDAKSTVAQDFHEHLRVLREGVSRIIQLTRQLLGDKEGALTFSRFLETVLPEDSARGRLIQDQLSQDTPEESLMLLRNSFGHFGDLADGLLRSGRVSYRLFSAFHGTLAREIGRNAFFNPLVALEFRAEFDRIRAAEVLDALHAVRSESAHRVLALGFLTLFRALRYAQMIDQYAEDATATRRAYIVLAVLRSDLRTLTRFLARQAADVIADGFERELLGIAARDIRGVFHDLSGEARALVSVRSSLEHLAHTLRIEVRRAFDHEIPRADARLPERDLGPQLVVASAAMRATLHHAIRTLCAELRPGTMLPELGRDTSVRRASSERLRREVWMFQQILRAFLAMSERGPGSPDLWQGQGSFQFVRDFLGHFRAIGYQLVRTHDYERLDSFLRALEELRDVDLLEPARMEQAVAECQSFSRFLGELFDRVSQRAELREVPFDRQAAAEMLRIYLGRN